MTITQMEYIVAVEKFGSFVTAAENCNVTQPTLSMQIQKLEDEFGIKLFDRNRHPVLPTTHGVLILDQVKKVLFEVNKVKELISAKAGADHGKLNVAILPTLAPYILPKMLNEFLEKFPDVEIQIFEQTTENIIKLLKEDKLDFAIMSTPLHDKELKETPIFYEQFVAYFSDGHALLKSKSINTLDLDISELWTLNDEHCMHFQAINLCEGDNNKTSKSKPQLQYQTGTIQSLVKMVENNGGCTVLPELCIEDFYEHQLENIRYFNSPEPVREVSIVYSRYFTKNKVASAFTQLIAKHIPEKMLATKPKKKIVLGIS
jgi:LysR family transcriptional regulator, hydrogen peroxide-inducible genes activator